MITLEDLIIEMMPFSQQLKIFCATHQDFKRALKIIYIDRFITLHAVGTSYSPNFPDDEVVGIYVYDFGMKNPQFKQDFIINKGGLGKDFVLYTGLSDIVDNKLIKHINEFLDTYGKGGYYKNAHHPRFEDFTAELKKRAISAVELANKRKQAGNPAVSIHHVQKIYKKLIKLKK